MAVIRSLPLVVLLLAGAASAQNLPDAAQAYLGEWLVMDDEGRPKAVMQVYSEGGSVHGRLVRSLKTEDGSVVCDECEGEYAGTDLRGLRVLRDMEWTGEGFEGGHILDPRSGKTYRATLTLEDRDHLRVRGYVGIKAFGKTQVWQRADRGGGRAAR